MKEKKTDLRDERWEMKDKEHGREEDKFERWEMRDKEHGREEDRFERWETENRERRWLRMHLGLGILKPLQTWEPKEHGGGA